MASTLVVETGTGSASADSFVTLAEIATYATSRGLVWPGSYALTDVLQDAAARLAFDYLSNERRYRYRGQRISATQRAPFPREGCAEWYGQTIADNVIPWRMKEAQCILACLIVKSATGFVNLQPALDRGGQVQTETIGKLTTTWFQGASAETVLQQVQGILEPILRRAGDLWVSPYFNDPDPITPTTVFNEGTFGNPQVVDVLLPGGS